MAAKDYEICVSGLTSTLYLAKVSKRNPNVMLEDRRINKRIKEIKYE